MRRIQSLYSVSGEVYVNVNYKQNAVLIDKIYQVFVSSHSSDFHYFSPRMEECILSF